ncbi:restriction endonuclease subunit S [Methylobacterium sp. EM32]|uniref:restriction endonuclease subunit S n=1 Tax=Methylobacterium sp. EM32 TaxID=3163481 RepID=UPI0033B5EDD7
MSQFRECRLGDVLTLQRGFDLPSALRAPGQVPVVSSSGITGFHSEAKVRGPGVIIGRYGTLGEVHFVQQDFWPLNTSLYVKDFKDNDVRYCSYLLRTVKVAETSSTAAVPGVNRNVLHEVPVRCPPLPTQRRIAAILGAYDDLVEVNRHRIALLEEMSQRLFEEWFVQFRFPGHHELSLELAAEGPRPVGWSWQQLRAACEKHNGVQTGPFGSQLHQSDYSDEGVPVVMPKNIIGLRVVEDDIARIPEQLANDLGRHRMSVGDIVYGRRGDIGRRAYISKREDGWFCGTGCLRLRPDRAVVTPRYLFDALGLQVTFAAIKARAQGATMPNLSAGALSGVPVMVPPLSLQQQYTDLVEPLAELGATIAGANDALRRSRDLLLPRLISGELSAAAAERELEAAA